MSTNPTTTLTTTIDAPLDVVGDDLADATTHPTWATEFFAGPAEPIGDGSYAVEVPLMGGPARMRVDADVERGIVDLYIAPAGVEFGEPLPVRLIPNGSGVDVLWTLGRPADVPDDAWNAGLASMQRELGHLKARHEGGV